MPSSPAKDAMLQLAGTQVRSSFHQTAARPCLCNMLSWARPRPPGWCKQRQGAAPPAPAGSASGGEDTRGAARRAAAAAASGQRVPATLPLQVNQALRAAGPALAPFLGCAPCLGIRQCNARLPWSGCPIRPPPRPLPRRCNEAVLVFSRLPPEHYQTGWVAVQVGRAFYEMVDYQAAENAFLLARQIDPYRLKAGGSASLCHCRAAPGPAQLSLP